MHQGNVNPSIYENEIELIQALAGVLKRTRVETINI